MEEERIGIEALSRAVTALGGQAATARICGVGQSAISECLRNYKKVPPEWCMPIHRATADKPSAEQRVTCHQLRCDLYPADFVPPIEQEAAA